VNTLLTLTIAGQTLRIASRAATVKTATGLLLFRGGLPVLDLQERLESLSDGAPAEVSTDVLLPSSVALHLAQGHRLGGGTAELSYLEEGASWEQRRVQVLGRIAQGSTGAAGEATRITIQGRPDSESLLFPPEQQVIGPDTFDIFGALGWDHAFEGRGYPQVFGRPGFALVNGTPATIAATPAYPVSVGANIVCLVAGHRADTRAVGSITMMDLTSGITQVVNAVDFAVQPQPTDDLGQEFQAAYVGGAFAAAWAAGHEIAASWTGAGGQVYRDTSLDRIGDVLRWALAKSGLLVDWRRTEPVCRSLDWLVGGYWDGRVTVWEWVRNNLLSILPISIVQGPDGLYPIRVDQPSEYRARAHLIDGLGSSYLGRDQEREDVLDTATLRYAVSTRGTAFNGYTLQADRPTGRGQGQTLPSLLRSTTGKRSSWEQTSGLVWDTATACQILQAQLSARAPRQVITVDSSEKAANILIGEHVLLSSTRYGLTKRPAVVRGLLRRGPRITVEAVVYSRS
jgi:hypothetical protein